MRLDFCKAIWFWRRFLICWKFRSRHCFLFVRKLKCSFCLWLYRTPLFFLSLRRFSRFLRLLLRIVKFKVERAFIIWREFISLTKLGTLLLKCIKTLRTFVFCCLCLLFFSYDLRAFSSVLFFSLSPNTVVSVLVMMNDLLINRVIYSYTLTLLYEGIFHIFWSFLTLILTIRRFRF